MVLGVSGRAWKSKKARENSAKALVLTALVIASSLVVVTFSSRQAPSAPSETDSGGPPPNDNSTGTLKLALSVLTTGPAYVSNQSGYATAEAANLTQTGQTMWGLPSLPSVNFTVTSLSVSQTPLKVAVAQPGEATMTVKVGLYRVTTRNGYYNLSAFATVSAGKLTEVDVMVTQSTMPVLFAQVYTPDSSPTIPRWEPLTLKVGSGPSPPVRGSLVLLELNATSPANCPGPCLPHVGSAVSTMVQQVDQRGGGVWLTVTLLEPLETKTLGYMGVSTLAATYSVRTLGA